MAEIKDDKKCCTQDEANREGTSLLTRFLPILDPVNAPVDPYNTEDILVFAKRYAELVRYYDFDDTVDCIETENENSVTQSIDTPDAENKQHYTAAEHKMLPEKSSSEKKKKIITWKEFFYNDIAVVVASISQYKNRLWHIKQEYNAIRKEIESNPTKENYRELFLSIIHHLKRIHRWYERSVDEHPLKNELGVKIKSFLVPALKKLIAYDKGMLVNTQDDLDLITQYETFKNKPWDCDYNKIDLDATIYVGDHLKKKIIYALMYVDDIFNTMYKAYEEITQRSGYYWQQAIEKFPSHQPHMALFISFVELFSYAKNELNNLTRRHLDFFYRDVLHLTEKPANPDSVYLIYQLAKGVDEFDLKQGTELTAGKDALGKQLVYKTDKELVIYPAKVKKLKTLFIDKGSPIENIYAAPVANSADGKGEKFKDPETAWPTFGYFEPRNDGDKITGEKAQFGFAFATPQLNLGQSDRTIDIKIFFENKKLRDGIAARNEPGKVQQEIKITKNDFEIYFSGVKEWIQPIVETETEDFQFEHSQEKITVPILFKNRLFNFLNSPDLTPDKLAPAEHSLGPIFDDASFGNRDNLDDYDLDKKTAAALTRKKTWKKLEELKAIRSLGDDKINDLIYSFSNKIVVADNLAKDRVLFFRTRIQQKQESLTSAGKDFKGFNFKTQNPVCKIIFNQDSEIYEALKDIVITKVEMSVDVKGLTDFIGTNDDGPFPIDKPVDILTSFPRIGSAFSFGASEFKNKALTKLEINGEWMGNPGFKNRYLRYGNNRTNPSVFKYSYELYYNNQWNSIAADPIQLFETTDEIDKNGNLTGIKNLKSNLFEVTVGDVNSPLQTTANENNNYQVVRFVLNAPDFGHEEYPILTAYQLANRLNVDGDSVDLDGTKDKLIFPPITPYTPRVKSFSLSYSSSQTLNTSNSQFFHIYPFGEMEIFYEPVIDLPASINEANFTRLLVEEKLAEQLIIPTTYLLPQFKFGSAVDEINKLKALNSQVINNHKEFLSKNYFQLNQYVSLEQQQGNLYIGIENLAPPQNLSLLFKFADGTAYDNDSEPPPIHWSYLANNEWLPLPQDHVISDSTYGFQTTGIILIDFPADATSNNTILTAGQHWLCASIDKDGNKIPKLIDVIAQANQATFSDQENDPAHYKNPLPEKSISKPLVKIPEVKVIDQPFESFDGKPREEGNKFYQRVSERLRHKGRAITPWDYEHLVLEEFPSVYKVKILSHTDPECLCRFQDATITQHKDDCCCPQVAPGHVLVVPISNLRNKNAVDPLKPRTGRRTLLKIEEFLKKRVSPFVHVHAKNPKFEEVKVSFNVKFYTGIDKGFYKRKLNDDLIHYLTPWAYDSNFEILFGTKIYASKIINFIEELDYVDYITCFRMIHLLEGCCSEDSLEDMDCDEMQKNLKPIVDRIKELEAKELATANEIKEKAQLKKDYNRFINEVSATSSQAILVSAKQHCINLIEEEPSGDDCNCKSTAVAPATK